jgi:hypothetical protein
LNPDASVAGWQTLDEQVLPQHPWPQRPQLPASVLGLTHVPPQHESVDRQVVPSATLVPVSVHTGRPLEHAVEPV